MHQPFDIYDNDPITADRPQVAEALDGEVSPTELPKNEPKFEEFSLTSEPALSLQEQAVHTLRTLESTAPLADEALNQIMANILDGEPQPDTQRYLTETFMSQNHAQFQTPEQRAILLDVLLQISSNVHPKIVFDMFEQNRASSEDPLIEDVIRNAYSNSRKIK